MMATTKPGLVDLVFDWEVLVALYGCWWGCCTQYVVCKESDLCPVGCKRCKLYMLWNDVFSRMGAGKQVLFCKSWLVKCAVGVLSVYKHECIGGDLGRGSSQSVDVQMFVPLINVCSWRGSIIAYFWRQRTGDCYLQPVAIQSGLFSVL